MVNAFCLKLVNGIITIQYNTVTDCYFLITVHVTVTKGKKLMQLIQ